MTLAIDRRGDLWGDRPAVLDQTTDERVSYADLAVRSERMAGRLAALGIEAGGVVGVVSRNRVELLALAFATRHLGAVFAPIPHRFTPPQAAAAIERLDPALVVHEPAQRDLVRNVPPHARRSFSELPHVEGADYREITPDRDAPSWLLATRTGRTVEYSERQVEWNAITAATAWGLGRSDRVALFDPLDEVHGLLGVALPVLYAGGTLVIQRAFDATDAPALVDGGAATCLFGSHVTLRALVEDASFETIDWTRVSWAVTHDRLDVDVADALRVQGVTVVRRFGQVECGPNALFVPPERATGTESPATVGRPFPDAEVRIVGPDGDPVGPGEAGDLWVGGPVIASGYCDAPDDVFRDGWVRTGERARLDPDSEFVVLARDDRG